MGNSAGDNGERGYTRRWLLASIAIGTGAALAPELAESLIDNKKGRTDSDGPPIKEITFGMGGPRAGGFQTHLDIADDDTLVQTNDVHNAHYRSPGDSEWTRFFRPGANYTPSEHEEWGNWDICIAAGNSDYIYCVRDGYFWSTNNKGLTISKKAAWNQDPWCTHADEYRAFGNRMRVDPATTDVVGVINHLGLKYTLDGGTSFVQHPNIPAPVEKVGSIAFNRASSVLGGLTQVVVVQISGNGIFISTTGLSGTFTKIEGQPESCVRAGKVTFGPNGRLHVCGDYRTGVGPYAYWSETTGWVEPKGVNGSTLAVDPRDGDRIWTYSPAGGPYLVTEDGFKTFRSYGSLLDTHTKSCKDVPWLEYTFDEWMSVGDAVHLNHSPKLVITDGIGTYEQNDDSRWPLNYVRSSISLGIDQLITQAAICTPSGRAFTTHQDRGIFMMKREDGRAPCRAHLPWQAASAATNPKRTTLIHGGSPDYAGENELYVVVPTYGGANSSFTTTGGGLDGDDWTRFSNLPTGNPDTYPAGGNMAVGAQGNILWLPTFYSQSERQAASSMWYTKDNAETPWKPVLFGGYRAGGHNYYTHSRIALVSDKTRPGTFFFYRGQGGPGDAQDIATKGFWKITNGGETTKRMRTTPICGELEDGGHHAKLKMPWNKPHLFWSASTQNNHWDSPSAGLFKFSDNDGVDWTEIPGLLEVVDFAFGHPAPGAQYPAIYANGFSTKDPMSFGVYAMYDFDPHTARGTWRLLSNFPNNNDLYYHAVAADPGRFGKVFWGSPAGVLIQDYE